MRPFTPPASKKSESLEKSGCNQWSAPQSYCNLQYYVSVWPQTGKFHPQSNPSSREESRPSVNLESCSTTPRSISWSKNQLTWNKWRDSDRFKLQRNVCTSCWTCFIQLTGSLAWKAAVCLKRTSRTARNFQKCWHGSAALQTMWIPSYQHVTLAEQKEMSRLSTTWACADIPEEFMFEHWTCCDLLRLLKVLKWDVSLRHWHSSNQNTVFAGV